MSTLFPPIFEKRYADYPRRWLNEYYVDGRRSTGPDAKGSCATLIGARRQAVRACDLGYCSAVRIFDRRGGQYVMTYKASVSGVTRHEGFVR